MNHNETVIEQEIALDILPVLKSEKKYTFIDAFLILSGYCMATWSYTQGAYLFSLVGFKQLLIGVFFGAILMLAIYQLSVILAVRYGIDIWIWLRAVFGQKGVKIITLMIIFVNYPWYAVCADLFASSLTNLAAVFGLSLPAYVHILLALSCVVIGTFIAYRGIGIITKITRFLVPVLLLVGIFVIIVGFSSVPFDVIWNYRPENPLPHAYGLSIEANFAFVITLVGGMAGIPRLTKTERAGYWAGVLGQGLSGSFFVVIGAVMAIAMQYVAGEVSNDPTIMLATLTTPILAISCLLLIAFANIGTQATGAYLYGLMLKSSFQKMKYQTLILILAIYVGILTIWGGVTTYFGSFLSIGACIYAPIAALLFTDFFIVRKQQISLRSAFQLPGYHAYDYTNGFNFIGLGCIIFGALFSLSIFNPVTGEIHHKFLFHLTPTCASFLGTCLLYYILNKIPLIQNYLLQDKKEWIQYAEKN